MYILYVERKMLHDKENGSLKKNETNCYVQQKRDTVKVFTKIHALKYELQNNVHDKLSQKKKKKTYKP